LLRGRSLAAPSRGGGGDSSSFMRLSIAKATGITIATGKWNLGFGYPSFITRLETNSQNFTGCKFVMK
jgi:hypothetical protein